MKLIILGLFAVLIYGKSIAQTGCPGQSQQEKEYQKYCARDNCFKSSGVGGGLCEPSKVATTVITPKFPDEEDPFAGDDLKSKVLLESFNEKKIN